MTIPSIRLKRKEENRILAGHLWVFSNEIEKIEGMPETGDVVEVRSGRNERLGFGFFNPKTLIAVRLFSKEFVEPDKDFFTRRLTSALDLRERLFGVPFYRLAYGESDFLPGLIVDRFGSLFSVQIFSAAMEKRKDLVFQSIMEVFSPDAVYERNEGATRELEGLPQLKSVIHGEEKCVDYDEDGEVEATIYDRSRLGAGAGVAGPAIIEEIDSSTVVPPGARVRVDEYGNLHIEVRIRSRDTFGA